MIAPVTVLVRTIGRPQLLRAALESLERCEPAPAEVVIVDQSDDLSSKDLIRDLELPCVRTVESRRRGRGIALNVGFENATQPVVLVVDDDCTVRSDWISVADKEMRERPDGIITGQVLPAGDDPRRVPSVTVMTQPRDYTGEVQFGPLSTGNMACPRESVLEIGGFDELIGPVAEDCDFCYRWLSAGRPLRHVPDLMIWHHDWRTTEQLRELYVDYARSRGMFYAKHLLAGDRRMVRYIAGDYRAGIASWLRREPRWASEGRGVFAGMPRGLWAGWRAFGPTSRGRAA